MGRKRKAPEESSLPGPREGFSVEAISGGLLNGEVKSKPKRVPIVPDHLPKLHCLCGAFGVVRSGKSNALVNLIKAYSECGGLNMLFCISPTYDSNTSLQTLPFEKEGVFTDSHNSVQALDKIIGIIQRRNLEYKEEKIYKAAYKAWRKDIADVKQFAILNRQHFRPPLDIKWPQPGIFIDDMTHTELMANTINNKLSHLSLHHRHLDGVGVSIFQAFQTFKSGMPRVVRANLGLIMLFPTCNMREIEEIYCEVSNNITFTTFKRLLFEATKRPHDFLLINKLADDPCKQFGINFDRVFIIDPVEERRKLLKLV
tara:strand:+ start:597 stop:1538 length:942 start_codon:yes stop_codon:yes gene_type:complete